MKNTSELSKTKQIKLINDAWRRMSNVFSTVGCGIYGKIYLDLNLQEERKHDRFRPATIKRGISVNQAARFFAVKRIAEYMNGRKKPDVGEFIFVLTSAYYAFSLVKQYKKELKKALKKIDLDEILKMDYCKLVE